MKQARPYPQVVVTRKAARSLKAGHPWVFEGEVVRMEPAADGTAISNGCVVDVFEENGTWQGAGLISQNSKIRVRMVTRNANDRIDEAFWARRVAWAWQHRRVAMGGRALPGCEPDTNCCRMVFSEADGMPGLIVDRYEHVLVTQVGTVGMEQLRPVIYPLLLKTLQEDGQNVCAIYERNDSPSRAKEGLPQYKGWWEGQGAKVPETPRIMVVENGLKFDLDIENSQKTGFFLDQTYNRRAGAKLAAGKHVRDCFTHTGSFALNAAHGGAAYVNAVDISELAVAQARKNAQLNGLDERMDFTATNVFDLLPALEAAHDRTYDFIVLDPPAFTKSRKTIQSASRGYKEINYRAMKLLPRGGYLATCSCSHFMDTERFKHVVASAAHNAGVQLRQIEERKQAPDHPIVWGVPETDYLKFFIFQVV